MDVLTAERYPIPEPDLPRRWRSTITPEQTDAAIEELKRLAPQRLSIAILADRLQISRSQVIRLAGRAGVDLSNPATTLVSVRDKEHPTTAAAAEARRIRDEELIRLAAEGWTDPMLARRYGISRNRVADIRKERGQPSGWFRDRPKPKPKAKAEQVIPAPNPPSKAQQLRLMVDAEHAARPRFGACLHCHTPHPLIDGQLRPHLYQGKPCPQSWRQPLTD